MARNDYKPRVYNDGICYLATENEKKSSFAARENGTTENDYKKRVKLMFAELSIREQDFEFAEARGRTLNRKIKTTLVSGWNACDKIIIDNMLYDIVNADKDRANNEIYFYLEEVRELVNA